MIPWHDAKPAMWIAGGGAGAGAAAGGHHRVLSVSKSKPSTGVIVKVAAWPGDIQV